MLPLFPASPAIMMPRLTHATLPTIITEFDSAINKNYTKTQKAPFTSMITINKASHGGYNVVLDGTWLAWFPKVKAARAFAKGRLFH